MPVIHLTDYGDANEWLLVACRKQNEVGLDTIVVSLKKDEGMKSLFLDYGISSFSLRNNFLELVGLFINLKLRRSKNDDLLLIAHSYKTALISLVLSFLGFPYAIYHHWAPDFHAILPKEYGPLRLVHVWLNRQSLNRAKSIFSTSKSTSNYLEKLGYKLKVLPNSLGMNFALVAKQLEDTDKVMPPSGCITISTLSRLSWEKNIDLVIRAVDVIREKGLPVRLKIIGVGPLYSKLLDLVKELSLEDSVDFLGWQNEPLKFVISSQVFVHVSLAESFGQAILESALAGMPIIATPVGVAPDLVDLGYQKIHIINVPDAGKIAEGIIRFAQEVKRDTDTDTNLELLKKHELSNASKEFCDNVITTLNMK